MANPAKRKGTTFESAVVVYLKDNGFPEARRVVQTGRFDTGDIHVLDFVGQAKSYRNIADAVREGVAGAQAQRVNAGLPFGVAFVKRPGKNIRESYAVMTLEDFAALLRAFYRRP